MIHFIVARSNFVWSNCIVDDELKSHYGKNYVYRDLNDPYDVWDISFNLITDTSKYPYTIMAIIVKL